MSQPHVQLINIFHHAFDNFVATARTCYSGRGIVAVEDVVGPPDLEPSELEKRRQRKHALATSLFKAGHHTTLQHAHVQFALDRVSRHFIWSFLHAHPFYNSEQVSQRYVTVKEENFHLPDTLAPASAKRYLECVRARMKDYHALCELLQPVVAQAYFARFNGRQGSKRADTDIRKKAQEAARYVLPVATHAYLYHTISVITLLRYHRVAQEFDTSAEQRRVTDAMVAALLAHEPEFAVVLEEPLPIEDTPEYGFFAERGLCEVDTDNARLFTRQFDADLNGAVSILVNHGVNNEATLADAVREVLGVTRDSMTDGDAIAAVLDPARNRLLGESMNVTTLSKLSRALVHPHYVFRKKLSHAADSQDQRHRLTPGSRPILMRHYTGEPDFITPEIMRQSESAMELYNAAMADTYETINQLLHDSETPEDVSYLLPNAVAVRFTEAADLLNQHHKMAMRLCYNAQEEIWRASLDETRAITAVNPLIGPWLLPPCGLRKHASRKPICPEGDRYCGVPVWRLAMEEYERII